MDATPAATRLAEKEGIDLATVKGTGKGGRVLLEDVQAATEIPEPREQSPIVDAIRDRGKVIDVFGPFAARTLIEIPSNLAAEIFQARFAAAQPTNVVDAVERDLAEIRERAPEVADSAVAAAAVRLAYELQNPFNSATSKSMCAARLIEAMDRLRELTPEHKEADKLDQLAERRAERIARAAAASG